MRGEGEEVADAGSAGAEPINKPVAPRGGGPLHIVCSPSRRVGKTMVARLLTEYFVADGRRVAAYDLADERPQLTDFVPAHASCVSIAEVRGQIRFFDSLIADGDAPKVIDVGHREFANFFTIADKIGLFEEARRRAIEPVILFVIDPDPVAAKAYATLRQWFPGTSLLPVRNLTVAKGLPYGAAFAHASTLPVSLEIPVLSPALRTLVEHDGFAFADIEDARLSLRHREALRTWLRRIRFQFREMELSLICEQILAALR
jgi:hypothetical protein